MKINKKTSLITTLIQWDHIAIYGVCKPTANDALDIIDYCSTIACCSLCKFVFEREEDCGDCPIKWPGAPSFKRGIINPPCVASYYGKWNNLLPASKEAKMWANKISDLALDALNKEWPEDND